MNQLVADYLRNRITRRTFIHSLMAAGLSAAAADLVAATADAADAPQASAPRKITGTGGELMVEQMKAAGVKYLFTNPGSFEVGFFDAFLDQPVQLIMGLHEGIVIAMADGYHKVSREPGFVNVHVIAGTAQASGQLYNASRDGSALVVTAGMIDNESASDDLMLAPRPGFDQRDVNRQFTKISWESRDGSAVPTILRRAFKVATTEPGGPVYVAFTNTALEAKNVSADIYDRNQFILPNSIPPDAASIERIAKRLIESKSPLIYASDEVTKAGAQAELLELSELLAIPVSEPFLPAFHNMPRQHARFAGALNTRGKDVVLLCGAPDFGGGAIPTAGAFEPSAHVACISLDTEAIGRSRPFNTAVIANVKLALRALVDSVKSMATAERIGKIADSRPANKKPAELSAANTGLSPMHPDELAWALEQELDRDAILVSENLGGSNQFYSTGFRDNEKMWCSNSGAGLGWGIGAAAGAKLAAPDRQVVCNIGDGSVMYSAAGFWSMARYHIPVLTVVCNNLNYQTVRSAYYRYGGKMKSENRYVGMYLGDPQIDFVKLAESQGIQGTRVENAADLRAALKRGIEATRAGDPYLIDVVVRRTGGGADSTWHQAFNLAEQRKRAV